MVLWWCDILDYGMLCVIVVWYSIVDYSIVCYSVVCYVIVLV